MWNELQSNLAPFKRLAIAGWFFTLIFRPVCFAKFKKFLMHRCDLECQPRGTAHYIVRHLDTWLAALALLSNTSDKK